MRRQRTLGIALVAVSLATMVGVAAATLSRGVTVEPIGSGTLARNFKVRQDAGLNVVIARFTIEPGGTTDGTRIPGRPWSPSRRAS
jgi:hypothetical protein